MVTSRLSLIRFASSTPNSRSDVAAPSTVCTAHPRARRPSASAASGAAPYPPPTRTQDTGSRGSANGLPRGPIASTTSPGRRSASHAVPAPCTASTISTVPPEPRSSARWTLNARRSRRLESSPPMASATKWPGRVARAIVGASSTSRWYAPARRTVTTSAATWVGPLMPSSRCRPAPRSNAWCSWRLRTVISPRIRASMPCTAAASPCTVVMHGTDWRTDAVRIS